MEDHTKDRQPGQDLANDFVSRALEAERTYLTSLWLDPVEGNNAACDAELCGADFILPGHAITFAYVCECAAYGLNATIAECISVAVSAGVQLGDNRSWPNTSGQLYLYCDILEPHLDEIREGSCLFYARAVKSYANQRREAQEAFRKYRHILVSEIPHRKRTTHAA